MMGLMLASCDEHEPIDPDLHIGYVLCDDHTAMPLEQFKAQSHINAVGVIFAESTDDHPAMAVMLDEIPVIAFSDTLGMKQGTSGDVTAYDGNTNTIALANTIDTNTGHGSPIADYVFRNHTFGQSDFIPSVAEMRLLSQSRATVNEVIRELGGDMISSDPTNGSCWYWTSTEVKENETSQAWLCSAANGGIQPTPKDERHPARAIVYLYYE